jgi:two-component system sensor histidine kinase/response regulator
LTPLRGPSQWASGQHKGSDSKTMPRITEPALAGNDIMIVDDNPANLKLLEDMLSQQGHEVRSFPRGRLALAEALRNPPDLILLDINMPEMNGYEVCEQLKATAEIAHVPIIFLSALNDTQDKVKAFQSGGVDYISKPFEFEEVQARVDTHLKLHNLQRALRQQNERLEATVALRTRELARANEQLKILDQSKNDFLNLISHEFRTPLHGIFGVSEIILDGMDATAENDELREVFDGSRQRIMSILDDALLLTQIDVSSEAFRPAPISLSSALDRAMQRATELAGSRHVQVSLPLTGSDLVMAEEDLLVKALRRLIETAIKFSDEGETVKVACNIVPGSVRIIIDSHGKTIPSSLITKFFDVFSVGEASTAAGNLGLGPAVAYRILSLFGASTEVANRDESGIQLTVSIPGVGA